MADEKKYYVLCANNCKFESMTKEQILAAIAQAVSTGEIKNVDTGFVTKIKEQNSGAALSFWVGTTAEYNAIPDKTANCFYILTDDTMKQDIENAINELAREIEILQTKTNADYVVEQGEITNTFNRTAINKKNDGSLYDSTKADTDIVEISDNIIWKYRKWNSGRVECWTSSCAMVTRINNKKGSIYISEHSFPQVQFPFNISVDNSAPVCNFDIAYNTCDFVGYIFAKGNFGYNKIPKIYAWSPTEEGTNFPVELTARIFAIGKWK